jgi:DNA-binding PadR family transcriptional regulator
VVEGREQVGECETEGPGEAVDRLRPATASSPLRPPWRACLDYYVTRSTRNVVEALDLGRYSDPPLLVMASLADGPKHGHAMIEDIVAMSGTRLGPGTLYGAIARLEHDGLIEPMAPEERRQPYRLTAVGRRVLRAKLATLHQFARAALRKLEAS